MEDTSLLNELGVTAEFVVTELEKLWLSSDTEAGIATAVVGIATGATLLPPEVVLVTTGGELLLLTLEVVAMAMGSEFLPPTGWVECCKRLATWLVGVVSREGGGEGVTRSEVGFAIWESRGWVLTPENSGRFSLLISWIIHIHDLYIHVPL